MPGCACPFNVKALRASAGAIYTIPLLSLPDGVVGLSKMLQSHRLKLCVAAADGDHPDVAFNFTRHGYGSGGSDGVVAADGGHPGVAFDFTNRGEDGSSSVDDGGGGSGGGGFGVALVVGNETRGVSGAVASLPGARCVRVPMREGAIDSLNVAVAGAILMDRVNAVN
jgi:tRNA G18 (ribose-2'-O)-methylase SpoU